MLGLVLFFCSVVYGSASEPSASHFPVGSDQQLEMFETWKSICLSESKKCSQFIKYPVDLEELKRTVVSSKKLVLAIDLGGSFLKIGVVEMGPAAQGNYQFAIIFKKKYAYESMAVDGKDIRDISWNEWVASRVREFVDEHCASDYPSIASLTFSYPVDQASVSSGKIKFVAKNWRFKNGKSLCQTDIVASLNGSLQNRSLEIEVKSVSNDVVSTYVCGHAHGHGNSIAVVMGTGTNAGFTLKTTVGESLENPRHGPSGTQKACKSILVNSEWASCPVPKGICTKADEAVMATKSQAYSGKLLFELLVAGVGFADIVRHTVNSQGKMLFPDEDDEKTVLKEINRVFYAEEPRPSDMCLYNVVRDFKIRSYKMIAPLIVASMVLAEQSSFTIITNGSCLQSEKDRDMFKNEISAFLSALSLSHYECSVEQYDEASLFGSVYLAAVSSMASSGSL